MSILIIAFIILGLLMILGGTSEGFFLGTLLVVVLFAIILI